MWKELMPTLVAAPHGRRRPRPERTRTGCVMQAMEDRLLMAIVAVNGGGNTPNGEAGDVPTRFSADYALVVTR